MSILKFFINDPAYIENPLLDCFVGVYKPVCEELYAPPRNDDETGGGGSIELPDVQECDATGVQQ